MFSGDIHPYTSRPSDGDVTPVAPSLYDVRYSLKTPPQDNWVG